MLTIVINTCFFFNPKKWFNNLNWVFFYILLFQTSLKIVSQCIDKKMQLIFNKIKSTFLSSVTFQKSMTPNRFPPSKWNWISVLLARPIYSREIQTRHTALSSYVKQIEAAAPHTLSGVELEVCVTPTSNVITHLRGGWKSSNFLRKSADSFRVKLFQPARAFKFSSSIWFHFFLLFFLHNNPNPAAYRGKSPSLSACISPCAVEVVTMLTWLPYWNFNFNHHFRLFRADGKIDSKKKKSGMEKKDFSLPVAGWKSFALRKHSIIVIVIVFAEDFPFSKLFFFCFALHTIGTSFIFQLI